MTDIFSKAKRSEVMARIRSRDTNPEKAGVRYSWGGYDQASPARPRDAGHCLPRYRTVVFVHGCFWHSHKGCKYAYQPKSRTEFWKRKLQLNVERDQIVESELTEAGWNVGIIWECELTDVARVKEKLALILDALAPKGSPVGCGNTTENGAKQRRTTNHISARKSTI